MPRCDIHLLGSRSGYTTIAASAGVSVDERRELEQLHFGEVGTRAAAERLRGEPAMAGFALRSGRFAISRMLPSDALDDAGRPTVEVVTIVLDADGYARAAGVLPRLANEIGWWDRARAGVEAGIEVPEGSASASPRDAAMRSILDLWLAVRATRGAAAGVLPASDARRLLEFVAVLDPADRCALRWGIGLRTVSGRVDLCALAPEGSAVGMRATIRPAPASSPHRARELEYVAVRATAGGATFAAVAEIDAMAGEVAVSAAEPRTVAARQARAAREPGRPMSNARLAAIGSSVLSTCVLIVAVLVQQSRPAMERRMGDMGESSMIADADTLSAFEPPIGVTESTASGFGVAPRTGSPGPEAIPQVETQPLPKQYPTAAEAEAPDAGSPATPQAADDARDGSRSSPATPSDEPPRSNKTSSNEEVTTTKSPPSHAQEPPTFELLRDLKMRCDDLISGLGEGSQFVLQPSTTTRASSQKPRPDDVRGLSKGVEEDLLRTAELQIQLAEIARVFKELLAEDRKMNAESRDADPKSIPRDELRAQWDGNFSLPRSRRNGKGQYVVEDLDFPKDPCSPTGIELWIACLGEPSEQSLTRQGGFLWLGRRLRRQADAYEALLKDLSPVFRPGEKPPASMEELLRSVWGETEYPNLFLPEETIKPRETASDWLKKFNKGAAGGDRR